MAGHGRGRGRGRGGQMLTFDKLESLGLTQSDLYSLSGAGQASSAQELYPPLPRKPVADTDYDPDIVKQAEIGQSIRSRIRQKFANLTKEDKKKDIDRYSDKYHNQQDEMGWTPDWSQFPDELRPDAPKKSKKRLPQLKPNLNGAKKPTSTKTAEQPSTSADQPSAKTADILAKAKEQLGVQLPEGGRTDEEEKNVDEEEKEEEEEEGELEEQDLDEEDETDYNLTYFDNGEGYGEDDDEDDEPAYN